MSTTEGGAAVDLVTAVERLPATRRRPFRIPSNPAPLAAHRRAEPGEDVGTIDRADPFVELGYAVERFEAAWSDLQMKIRRAIDGRGGRG